MMMQKKGHQFKKSSSEKPYIQVNCEGSRTWYSVCALNTGLPLHTDSSVLVSNNIYGPRTYIGGTQLVFVE